MGDHSKGVTKNYLAVKNTLPNGYWDEAYKERSYYADFDNPAEDKNTACQQIGEFDILAVNYTDQTFLYIEVKTNMADLKYAQDQLERAEEFFAPDWDMIGQTYLER